MTYEYGYNYSFTSQYMIDNENNHFKVNIFYSKEKDEEKITFGVFLKKGSDKRFSHDPLLTTNYKDIECMKSMINANHSRTLVTLYTSSGELKSFIYDINTHEVLKLKQNFIEFFVRVIILD